MEAISQSNEPHRAQTYLVTENGKEVEVGVLAPKIVVRSDKKGYIYVPFLDERVIDYIAALIEEMVRDGFDCIVMITGRRRTGKSTLGLQIARKVAPTFGLESVAFRVEDFSEILDKNPYADPDQGRFPQALLDEAGHGLYSKEWMSIWQRNLVKCLEVIGMKNQVCYFILPHMRKLTGDVRDEMAHIWIDVDTKYKHERGYAELYMGIRNKFEQSIWWNPKCAFKFNDLKDDFWTGYEAKKIAFVNEIAAEKITSSHTSKDAERLDALMAGLHDDGMHFKEIGTKLNLSEQRVCNRVNQYLRTRTPAP
jgi:hypothetical protein